MSTLVDSAFSPHRIPLRRVLWMAAVAAALGGFMGWNWAKDIATGRCETFVCQMIQGDADR